ncbi:Disintegrin and metalloproteinase domain-containing protein 11 [Hondaea fermentalgiana]|uniref:Disintegrin and metalloproteinase domain-containing protein 11 n=1 Tax=Hondaea fermentalgiana TaxID=2315210 RepID=A0A2R5G4L1_9STRA|nr:Disintegrin and metalloproteinase domain-containing protein 11 [Hondaea fermentalgiana]|eukprot:GBG24728.1 Disintegrin and metalloproteinase domain-containing protein 11 [Hondaea fermentalgiana]
MDLPSAGSGNDYSEYVLALDAMEVLSVGRYDQFLLKMSTTCKEEEDAALCALQTAAHVQIYLHDSTHGRFELFKGAVGASDEVAVQLGDINPVLVANVDQVVIRTNHTVGTTTHVILDQISLWGCTTQKPTLQPTLAPTFAPVDWTIEPFTEIVVNIVSIDWITKLIEVIEGKVQEASETATGWTDFAFVNQFTAEWTETFDLEVDSIGDCVYDQEVMERTLALARCGSLVSSSNSSCEATLSVDGDVISVRIDLYIGSVRDAHLLDRRQTAPTYDTATSTFLTTLQSSVEGCWAAYASIEGPDDLEVTGTLVFEVSVQDHVNTGDESTSAQNVGKELEDALGGDALENDQELMKDLPNAVNITVERCPASRLCSGNGVCCDAASQYTIDCSEEEFGKCICNDPWTGFDCSIYDPELTPTVAPTDAKCIPRESFGGEGASAAMLALCAAEGACQSNPLMCEYWKSIDYASAGITACEDGSWFEVFHQFDCRVTFNLGRTIINSLFDLRKMWRYDIGAETYLYYKYTSASLPENYSAYDMMLNEWSSMDGKHLINANFSLFASEVDAVNGTNAWQWSNYDDAVGFPRDARPIALQSNFDSTNQTWSAYVTSFYYKWAKAHCTVSQHKTPVKEFSFSLCIPESESALASAVSSTSSAETSSESVTTYTVSGTIRDIQTGGGAEARVRLYRGRVAAWEGVTPLENVAATFLTTSVAADVGSDGLAGFTSCLSAMENDTATASDSTEDSVYIQSSTFQFDALAAGTYTVVISYESGLVGSTVLGAGAFTSRVDTFEVVDADVSLTFDIARSLPSNAILVVFESKMLGLDAVVEFSAAASTIEEDSEVTTCVVSAKLLADGACSCGSAHLVRADSVLQDNGKATTVIYFSELYQTQYKLYLSRTDPVGTSAYKKHRDDGRCGPTYPLSSGEAARCPPVAVTWGDGIKALRPCCHILSGQCGSGDTFCGTRWSIDYRMFLDDAWMTQYRDDLLCNRPEQLYSSDGADDILAKCPEDAPCCSPQGKCGSLSYHCDSARSIDYREFYEEALAANETSQDAVEESETVISVYSASGLAESYTLPDPLVQLNYFDGHEYTAAEATASSTYMRAFCIDATATSPQLYEYPAPRYFEFKGQMLGMSSSCPAESDCNFARVTGMQAAFEREDGTYVPALSGIYLRRYEEQGGFKAYVGAYVDYDVTCRAAVTDPSDGVSRWYISVSPEDWDPASCIELCEEDDDCQVVATRQWIDSTTQEYKYRCSFHKNIHLCNGLYTVSTASSSSTYMVYRRRSSLAASGVWYSQLSSMFNDADDQVHLYRDETSNTWYMDNDLVPGNGHFALAVSSEDSEIPPSSPWRYVTSFAEKSTSAHTGSVSVLAFEEDCLVGGNFPTLNSTAENAGCECWSASSSYNCYGFTCSTMRLRIEGTDICLEGDASLSALMSNKCELGEIGQAFLFDTASQQLEVRATNATDGTTVHYVVSEGFALTKVISSSVEVEDALSFDLTEEGYICLAQGTREYSSYVEAEEDQEDQSCIFLASAPGDLPLLVDYSRRSEWSVFVVV